MSLSPITVITATLGDKDFVFLTPAAPLPCPLSTKSNKEIKTREMKFVSKDSISSIFISSVVLLRFIEIGV